MSVPTEHLDWRRSTRCSSAACVEVAARGDGGVFLRDSKNPEVVLTFTAEEWTSFVAGAAGGEFDLR